MGLRAEIKPTRAIGAFGGKDRRLGAFFCKTDLN